MSTPDPQQLGSEPTWEIAHLFPGQGHWTETDYLALRTNRLVELSSGNVEVLDVPTEEPN